MLEPQMPKADEPKKAELPKPLKADPADLSKAPKMPFEQADIGGLTSAEAREIRAVIAPLKAGADYVGRVPGADSAEIRTKLRGTFVAMTKLVEHTDANVRADALKAVISYGEMLQRESKGANAKDKPALDDARRHLLAGIVNRANSEKAPAKEISDLQEAARKVATPAEIAAFRKFDSKAAEKAFGKE